MSRAIRCTPSLLALLLTLALPACDTTPTSANPAAEFAFALTPSPVNAVTSTQAEYAWRAVATGTLTESGGVTATIESITAEITEASSGIQTSTVSSDDYRVTIAAESNTLAGDGVTAFQVTIDYRLPNDGREALLAVSVTVLDENNYRQTVSDEISVL